MRRNFSYASGMNISIDPVIDLLHSAAAGVLATQSAQMPGYPFASVLPFVLDERHAPVFLISRLAEHTKNLLADGRASFLVHGGAGPDVLKAERVSLLGDVGRIEPSPGLLARYLRHLPDAQRYLDLGDFAFFRFAPNSARYIAGFGQMGWIGASDWADAAVLAAGDEQDLLRAIDSAPAPGVTLAGLDCYGIDIARDGVRQRLRFPTAPLAPERIGAAARALLSTLPQNA